MGRPANGAEHHESGRLTPDEQVRRCRLPAIAAGATQITRRRRLAGDQRVLPWLRLLLNDLLSQKSSWDSKGRWLEGRRDTAYSSLARSKSVCLMRSYGASGPMSGGRNMRSRSIPHWSCASDLSDLALLYDQGWGSAVFSRGGPAKQPLSHQIQSGE